MKPKSKIPLITVPGLKGSVLSSPDGKPAWLTRRMALGLSNPSLALPAVWREDGVQERDDLLPTHTLKKISFLGMGADVYGPWLVNAKTLSHYTYEFVWDWRRSFREAYDRFEAYVNWIITKHDSPVQIVAHSAGCLVALAVVNRHPQWFHSLVFVAPPLKPNICGMMGITYGEKAGMNSKVLPESVVFTFPSVLVLLPTVKDYEEDVGYILNNRGIFEAIDLTNSDEYGIGLAANKHLDEKEMRFLDQSLKDAMQTKAECVFKKEVKYPPLTILASKSFPTYHKAILDGPRSTYGLDIETPPKVPGDSTVPWNDTFPPPWVHFEHLESMQDHMGIVNDPQLRKIVMDLQVTAPVHKISRTAKL